MKKNIKSKTLANWSLGVMGAGFIASIPFSHYLWGKLLQGGFESGLVGGLADWFAVTALFRHPLNIPIPHTALLPKNREKITNAILNVLQNEWLTKESIIQKVNHIEIANLLLEKVEKELHSEEMKKHLKTASIWAAEKVDVTPFEPQLEKWAKTILKSVKTEGIVKKLIDKSIENQIEQKIYKVALQIVDSKLSNSETKAKMAEMITKVIEKKSESRLFGIAVKPLMNIVGSKKIAELIDAAITELLNDLNDENSENRKKIIEYIKNELLSLKENESLLSQIENMKQSMIEEYDMKPLLEAMNTKVHDIILSYVQKEGFVENTLLPIIEKGIQKLKEHPTALKSLDSWIKEKIIGIIEENHEKIGQLVRDNLEKMSNEEITDLLEDKLGKDITWIRVNGALCGCIIGLILTGIRLATGS